MIYVELVPVIALKPALGGRPTRGPQVGLNGQDPLTVHTCSFGRFGRAFIPFLAVPRHTGRCYRSAYLEARLPQVKAMWLFFPTFVHA